MPHPTPPARGPARPAGDHITTIAEQLERHVTAAAATNAGDVAAQAPTSDNITVITPAGRDPRAENLGAMALELSDAGWLVMPRDVTLHMLGAGHSMAYIWGWLGLSRNGGEYVPPADCELRHQPDHDHVACLKKIIEEG